MIGKLLFFTAHYINDSYSSVSICIVGEERHSLSFLSHSTRQVKGILVDITHIGEAGLLGCGKYSPNSTPQDAVRSEWTLISG